MTRPGPTISFRGIDNASWYRLMPDDPGRLENLTGCGNTVNVMHPHVTQFVLDSLRYWVQEMGVDGFRFDLAPVLGRTQDGLRARRAVLHRAAPGPDPRPRAPDRRALGRRARRLPGGPLPGPLPRMERQVPRHRAPLLAARRHAAGRRPRRARAPLHRVQRPVQPWPAHAARVGQLHRGARRLHAGRPRELRAQAQRGQRRGQPRRPRRRAERELRRRRARPTTRASSRSARACGAR